MPFDLSTARPVGQKETMTGKEVVSKAIENFPASFRNVVTGAYEAVTSPVQTAKTMFDIGAGAFTETNRCSQFAGFGESVFAFGQNDLVPDFKNL